MWRMMEEKGVRGVGERCRRSRRQRRKVVKDGNGGNIDTVHVNRGKKKRREE